MAQFTTEVGPHIGEIGNIIKLVQKQYECLTRLHE